MTASDASHGEVEFLVRLLQPSSSHETTLRRRRKFTTSVQPAKAYEDESVMSGLIDNGQQKSTNRRLALVHMRDLTAS